MLFVIALLQGISMDGLRYYVMPLLICAPLYGAQEESKQQHNDGTQQPNSALRIVALLPAENRLRRQVHAFFIPFDTHATAIGKIKKELKEKISDLAQKESSCECGDCAESYVARRLNSCQSIQMAYLGQDVSDETTITQLRENRFNPKNNSLYAKFD